ncbi:hypothetical protein [Nitrosomonas eutropha]|uniref:Uncharacterized protein n=1 Tax=Nitrosomonas eutropha TaxID=916 RepID=A0ABX5M9K0_9PROT|nr:hypothetical protein [Nitrosomonas eutropha]PXV82382.1 hypothetical protein C8R14_10895 [Nitrosomonas eutropha]SCX12807.1 hypothetical protein SAMN05216379_10812 [Nitrosomonas eutropha]SDW16429.1 hypothetical protein SAMN05216317_102232 [Nitrosomonas eutropha]SEI66400.1 hypothetical protein SAMN05216318_1081 [Nitrosomonas eutropha]
MTIKVLRSKGTSCAEAVYQGTCLDKARSRRYKRLARTIVVTNRQTDHRTESLGQYFTT